MLKDAVLAVARSGKFHIWPVKTIDEGIEVLTGVNAGRRTASGGFDVESVNDRVDRRLKDLAEKIESFGKSD